MTSEDRPSALAVDEGPESVDPSPVTELVPESTNTFFVAGLLLTALVLVVQATLLSWDLPGLVHGTVHYRLVLLASFGPLLLGGLLLGGGYRLAERKWRAAVAESLGEEAFRSEAFVVRQYEKMLFGIGYFLLVMGLACTVLVAGLIQSGRIETSAEGFSAVLSKDEALDARRLELSSEAASRNLAAAAVGEEPIGPNGAAGPVAGTEPTPPVQEISRGGGDTAGRASSPSFARMPDVGYLTGEMKVALMLVLACLMSIFGGLFFVTNSLREKSGAFFGDILGSAPAGPRERFEPRKFWGGLLFRLGEAVLFTFAFFWLFWKYAHDQYTWLPVVALFLGMFVKSGETLIFGIGKRLLDAAGAMFPFEKVPQDRLPADQVGADKSQRNREPG